jgi:hypothetical protein
MWHIVAAFTLLPGAVASFDEQQSSWPSLPVGSKRLLLAIVESEGA